MTEVGILEAKTHLSRLIEQVEKGEEVVITRHGKPVARLGPLQARHARFDVAAFRADLQRLRELRQGRSAGINGLRGLLDAGRREET
jgi:prevent-host-death family protein